MFPRKSGEAGTGEGLRRALFGKAPRGGLEIWEAAANEGAKVDDVASQLGVHRETLRRWARASRQAKSKLRPVTIVDEPRRKLLSIVLPNGIRIEGLDAGGVVEMLRRLA